MKKNVNLFLFALLIVVLISMIAMALYFNNNYENLIVRYNIAIKNVNDLTQKLNETIIEVNKKNLELVEREKILNDIIKELNLSEQKVSTLGEFYTKEKSIREELQENLKDTERERDKWKLQYTETKQDLEIWKKNYDIKVQELNTANKRINLLNSIVNDISSEISSSDGADKTTTELQGLVNTIDSELDQLEKLINEIDDPSLRADFNEKASDVSNAISSLKTKIEKLRTSINVIKNSLKRA